MPKGYIVTVYHSISDPEALARYAKLAGPALEAGGGKFLVRGNAVEAYEKGLRQRVVVVEFESLEKAVAARKSAAYEAALALLGSGAVRDMRIVQGLPSS